ncbi:hypothetical protein EVAR_13506_1 [Eumeta japonica]|uniref:Uncharacterized protein n=1 Tax=Eumeta variegata TaxID=151549 RepID=A0A4C1UZD6_EUMVA|nr:hypothetical protein EVAR_13506_1 [Eumeta japonica]
MPYERARRRLRRAQLVAATGRVPFIHYSNTTWDPGHAPARRRPMAESVNWTPLSPPSSAKLPRVRNRGANRGSHPRRQCHLILKRPVGISKPLKVNSKMRCEQL